MSAKGSHRHVQRADPAFVRPMTKSSGKNSPGKVAFSLDCQGPLMTRPGSFFPHAFQKQKFSSDPASAKYTNLSTWLILANWMILLEHLQSSCRCMTDCTFRD